MGPCPAHSCFGRALLLMRRVLHKTRPQQPAPPCGDSSQNTGLAGQNHALFLEGRKFSWRVATGKIRLYSIEGSTDRDPQGETYFGRPFCTDRPRTLGIRAGEESSEQTWKVTLFLPVSAFLWLLQKFTCSSVLRVYFI